MYPVTVDWSGGWTFKVVIAVLLIYTGVRIFLFVRSKDRNRKEVLNMVVLLVVTVLLGGLFLGVGQLNTIAMEDGVLRVRFFTGFKTIEITKEEIEEYRVLDWSQETEYRPVRRNLGMALGSYREGRFTLENGETALLLTSSSNVMLLDTAEGILLLGPDDMEAFQTDLEGFME